VIESLAGQEFDVQRAYVMLEVSSSGYYAWKDRPPRPSSNETENTSPYLRPQGCLVCGRSNRFGFARIRFDPDGRDLSLGRQCSVEGVWIVAG
jgi:hypothetical protein